jgi:hypothetical protein
LVLSVLAVEPAAAPVAAEAPAGPGLPAESAEPAEPESSRQEDLLGLEAIFKEETGTDAGSRAAAISEADIERIAERVIQKVSAQVIENIAWDVIPDLTEKIVREELKRADRGGMAAIKKNES